MPEEFDTSGAAERHDYIIREAQRIRDGLTRDVIDYYYDSYPDSEEKQREQIAGMRKYLDIAYRDLDNLIREL
jgi:predicted solute-binding protein